MAGKKLAALSPPTIGPRDYVCRGPSGWPEAYDREESDEMLMELLANVPLTVAISSFIESDQVRREGLIWPVVLAFLSRITQTDVDRIPLPAAVAFWAKAIKEHKEQRNVRLN
jgi:hypothetical protein